MGSSASVEVSTAKPATDNGNNKDDCCQTNNSGLGNSNNLYDDMQHVSVLDSSCLSGNEDGISPNNSKPILTARTRDTASGVNIAGSSQTNSQANSKASSQTNNTSNLHIIGANEISNGDNSEPPSNPLGSFASSPKKSGNNGRSPVNGDMDSSMMNIGGMHGPSFMSRSKMNMSFNMSLNMSMSNMSMSNMNLSVTHLSSMSSMLTQSFVAKISPETLKQRQQITLTTKLMLPVYYSDSPIEDEDVTLARSAWDLVHQPTVPLYTQYKNTEDYYFPFRSPYQWFVKSFFRRFFDIHPVRCICERLFAHVSTS
jgi:hypothetical protein